MMFWAPHIPNKMDGMRHRSRVKYYFLNLGFISNMFLMINITINSGANLLNWENICVPYQ